MLALKTLFWGSLGALAWTHAGYPLAAGALARGRERRVAKDASFEPSVSVIVAAYNEEAVIERRLENLLALDYPPTGSRSSSPPTRRATGRTSSSRP